MLAMDIRSVVEEFSERLHALIEVDAMERARTAIVNALGGHPVRRVGRPPKATTALPAVATAAKKSRKKPPRQLCPVPGCKNTAAPVFGMVCADHKNVAKSKLKKYREARKAKKLGLTIASKSASKKRTTMVAPKKRKVMATATSRAKQAKKAATKVAPKPSPAAVQKPAVPATA